MLKWLLAKFKGKFEIRGYTIGEHFFEGGFSNIYRAYRTETNELVALKILTESGARVAEELENKPDTIWEGPLLASLDHPHIVKCIEYSKRPPYWIAMQYVRRCLSEYVGQCDNEEEENELVRILHGIVSALSYLHGKGLIHRDICMDNIMLDPAGEPKLIDFGLTVPIHSSGAKGRAGTPSYMAPDMIRTGTHTAMTDIYSFGVVMYELVVGNKPFKGEWREMRMTRSLNVNPPAPSRVGRYCSPELEDLLMRCLEKDPAKRFNAANTIQDAFFLMRRERGLM